MAMTDISREYGTAIFMLACESGAKKEYYDAMTLVKEELDANPEYVGLLASPGISLRERINAVGEVFGGRVPEDVLSYVQLMCEKGRISYFSESAEVFFELYDASERIYNAKITSAVELTDEEKIKLIRKLETVYGGSVAGEYFVDAAIIGGIVVEVDGNIMDGSLRKRLQDVKEVMNS